MQTRRQKIQLGLVLGSAAKGEARSAGRQGTKACMARATPERPATRREAPMEPVLQAGNLKKALACFRRSQGAASVDCMTDDDLGAHLRSH